ncbi:MAG: winged helix-turn-helix transcriptional regulator [Methanomethylovorans sp.]|nr:winged helix-turn-helix transcriptional regulator [Methanomethylovorans sp.]
MFMNKNKVICLNLIIYVILCLFFIPMAEAANVATVHGAIYDWDTFNLLENTIVEVNSTPPQSQVAKYGLYSFELPRGIYILKASYYENGELASYTEQVLNITDDGDYILDLLLLPAYPDGNFSLNDSHTKPPSMNEDKYLFGKTNLSKNIIFILTVILFIGGVIVLFILKKRHDSEKADIERSLHEITELENLDYNDLNLPQDLQQLIEIIKANGGRITQRELRRKINYSEAKVSLMISDLENRGIIEKFKKGRGNIILLKKRGST